MILQVLTKKISYSSALIIYILTKLMTISCYISLDSYLRPVYSFVSDTDVPAGSGINEVQLTSSG